MPKYAYDGIIQLHFVPESADLDLDAPGIDSIEDGVDLTPFLRALDTPFEGSTVEAGTADSRFNSTVSGTFGGQPVTATLTRDKVYADDDAWTTLAFATAGNWVIAWRGGSGVDGALAIGDRVDVVPIDIISRNPEPYGRNVLAALNVQASTPAVPGFDVAIVAGGS